MAFLKRQVKNLEKIATSRQVNGKRNPTLSTKERGRLQRTVISVIFSDICLAASLFSPHCSLLRNELTRVCCCCTPRSRLLAVAAASNSLYSFTCFVFKCFIRFVVLKLVCLTPPLETFVPQVLHIAIVLDAVSMLKYFHTADIFFWFVFPPHEKAAPALVKSGYWPALIGLEQVNNDS